MKILLLAIGKARGPHADLCAEYAKRLKVPCSIKELSGATQKVEGEALCRAIPPHSFVVLLDEGGKDMPSLAFAATYAQWQERGQDSLVFIIGGADGLTPDIRARADFILSLGQKTWPHMLARVMLLEQIYRAQQINQNHPYHRGAPGGD